MVEIPTDHVMLWCNATYTECSACELTPNLYLEHPVSQSSTQANWRPCLCHSLPGAGMCVGPSLALSPGWFELWTLNLWNMYMVLLCFVVFWFITVVSAFMWFMYPYSSGLLHWHWAVLLYILYISHVSKLVKSTPMLLLISYLV